MDLKKYKKLMFISSSSTGSRYKANTGIHYRSYHNNIYNDYAY